MHKSNNPKSRKESDLVVGITQLCPREHNLSFLQRIFCSLSITEVHCKHLTIKSHVKSAISLHLQRVYSLIFLQCNIFHYRTALQRGKVKEVDLTISNNPENHKYYLTLCFGWVGADYRHWINDPHLGFLFRSLEKKRKGSCLQGK